MTHPQTGDYGTQAEVLRNIAMRETKVKRKATKQLKKAGIFEYLGIEKC
jgi:hypothetical protein